MVRRLVFCIAFMTGMAAAAQPAPGRLEIGIRQGDYHWVVETASDGSRRGGWVQVNVPLDAIDRTSFKPLPALDVQSSGQASPTSLTPEGRPATSVDASATGKATTDPQPVQKKRTAPRGKQPSRSSEATRSATKKSANDLRREYEQRLVAYRDCAFQHADSYVNSAEAPADIADAALHQCGTEFNQAHEAASEWASAARGSEAKLSLIAVERMPHSREDLRSAVTSRVLQAREEAKAVPAKTRETSHPGSLELRAFLDCVSDGAHGDSDNLPPVTRVDNALEACQPEYMTFQAAAQAPFVNNDEDTRRRMEALGARMRESFRQDLISELTEKQTPR
jgi:hypothetical protein